MDFDSGDLNVQVKQAGVENLPGVTMRNAVAASQKGKRKDLCQVAKQTFPPASVLWLKVEAESSAFHARVAREAHVMSVEVGNS